MRNSIVKLVAGVWLVLSGLITALQSPINLIIVGAILAICCFLSRRTWQIITTGILGLWLFISGMINVVGSAAVPLVTSANFIIVGLIVLILAVWSYSKETKLQQVETKSA